MAIPRDSERLSSGWLGGLPLHRLRSLARNSRQGCHELHPINQEARATRLGSAGLHWHARWLCGVRRTGWRSADRRAALAVVMAQANHSRTDIMKSTIQQEAEKAAKKIREALVEFQRETGLSADIDARWTDVYRLGFSEPVVLLEHVDVRPIHPASRA